MDVIKNRRAQTNPLLICTLQDFNEAGTRQSGFFFSLHQHNATAFTSDMQKYAFKNNRHSNLKLDKFEQLFYKTPSYLSVYRSLK